MSKVSKVPPFDAFMNPIIQALDILGGSGNIEEIDTKVIEITQLTREHLEVLHNPAKSSQTEVEYRLAWARTYLKKYGILENSSRGVWALTLQGREIGEIDPRLVKAYVREQSNLSSSMENASEVIEVEDAPSWQDEVMQYLL